MKATEILNNVKELLNLSKEEMKVEDGLLNFLMKENHKKFRVRNQMFPQAIHSLLSSFYLNTMY